MMTFCLETFFQVSPYPSLLRVVESRSMLSPGFVLHAGQVAPSGGYMAAQGSEGRLHIDMREELANAAEDDEDGNSEVRYTARKLRNVSALLRINR